MTPHDPTHKPLPVGTCTISKGVQCHHSHSGILSGASWPNPQVFWDGLMVLPKLQWGPETIVLLIFALDFRHTAAFAATWCHNFWPFDPVSLAAPRCSSPVGWIFPFGDLSNKLYAASQWNSILLSDLVVSRGHGLFKSEAGIGGGFILVKGWILGGGNFPLAWSRKDGTHWNSELLRFLCNLLAFIISKERERTT